MARIITRESGETLKGEGGDLDICFVIENWSRRRHAPCRLLRAKRQSIGNAGESEIGQERTPLGDCASYEQTDICRTTLALVTSLNLIVFCRRRPRLLLRKSDDRLPLHPSRPA